MRYKGLQTILIHCEGVASYLYLCNEVKLTASQHYMCQSLQAWMLLSRVCTVARAYEHSFRYTVEGSGKRAVIGRPRNTSLATSRSLPSEEYGWR